MARQLIEIEASLVERQPGLSTSATAEWRIWVSIFAYAIWLFELVLDVFKADVENQLAKKQAGTLEWYSEQALSFQNGYALTVDEWGVVSYATEDLIARIVKRASVSEQPNGSIMIKVAGLNAQTNELEPLGITTGQFMNFQQYMNRKKFAGTWVEYRTLPADTIEYDVEVYYDPLYVPAAVQANIESKLDGFRTAIDFDARLFKSDFVAAIQSIPGVKTVKVNFMTIIPAKGDPIELDVVAELASGYFNYSNNSTITMINVNA